ncbi:winged helix-turn-helix domain-containing protein [Alicyclobacillus shizuokensis]|uniref:winged helix-turn-helix domain-containing protein n=1 Tax=Alicyclobacillus shizuokensis TaxID=392014 RepID=UPI000AA68234|nr:winged helix-turn-helix domain-containing protein [Alicyclobacillus shizuokensis]
MDQAMEHVYLDHNLYLDLKRLTLMKGTTPIPLSVTQFLILRCLCEHLDRPVSSDEIIHYAWNAKVEKSELHKQINRIREKLEPNPRKPQYLLTVRGFGYLLHSHVSQPPHTSASNFAKT